MHDEYHLQITRLDRWYFSQQSCSLCATYHTGSEINKIRALADKR